MAAGPLLGGLDDQSVLTSGLGLVILVLGCYLLVNYRWTRLIWRRRQDSGEFVLSERPVEAPYVKDYDGIPGEGPSQWAGRFDISRWGFIRAESGGRIIGGAVLAFDTGDVAMLEGRSDLAVLWDIRVSPHVRGKGIGSGLVRSSEAWATSRGCRQLKVETQNINLPACRFYRRQGFILTPIGLLIPSSQARFNCSGTRICPNGGFKMLDRSGISQATISAIENDGVTHLL